jgi:hypothetical protein
VNTPYSPKISRRTTLRWMMVAAAALTAGPRYAVAGANRMVAYEPTPKGYGTDPNLLTPVVPWARIMTPRQLQLTAAVADYILPATAHAPAPSSIGIPDFVDEWVSAPYPFQVSDREIILAGLAWVDEESKKRWHRGFLEIDDQRQQIILDMMATERNGATATSANLFFRRLRFVVVGAYYTTPEGFKDIGYIGNVALASYPPPTKDEIAILEAELDKLGMAKNSSPP